MAKKIVFSRWMLCLSVILMLAIPTSGINCGDAPTLPCCNSAQALKKIVVSKPDRQSLCECFMQIAPTLGVNFKRANQLLSSCKLNLSMTITSDMDRKKCWLYRPVPIKGMQVIISGGGR
ncbi:hypothetical protein AAG906_015020 [Vitis piasezkii]